MKATIFFDGGVKNNPGGPICGAAILYIEGQEKPVETGVVNPSGTNNTAEYKGLISGLKKALELGVTEIEVFGDSNLVVQQVLGNWKVRKEDLKPLHRIATKLFNDPQFKQKSLNWVPREQNKEADKLAGIKLKEYVQQNNL